MNPNTGSLYQVYSSPFYHYILKNSVSSGTKRFFNMLQRRTLKPVESEVITVVPPIYTISVHVMVDLIIKTQLSI